MGLEVIAKLMINAQTGKWSFNDQNCEGPHAILPLFDNNAAVASIPRHNECTLYKARNVYIAVFIYYYACAHIHQIAQGYAHLPFYDKVLYIDTDGVIFVSPSGKPLIPIDHTNILGL